MNNGGGGPLTKKKTLLKDPPKGHGCCSERGSHANLGIGTWRCCISKSERDLGTPHSGYALEDRGGMSVGSHVILGTRGQHIS